MLQSKRSHDNVTYCTVCDILEKAQLWRQLDMTEQLN